MNQVNLTINGKPVSVPEGTSILDAAKTIDINIHNLCNFQVEGFKKLETCASCRVCMVDTDRGLVPACGTVVRENMIVKTNSLKALNTRRKIVELILSDHPDDCLVCYKNGACQLQEIAADLGIKQITYKGAMSLSGKDTSSKSIVRDQRKCILCRKCESMCNEIQTVGTISGVHRGFNTIVSTFFDRDIAKTECTFCGQCAAICPTGSLKEAYSVPSVYDHLLDESKVVIAQIAPAVRVSIGEEFGLHPGELSTKKLVATTRSLGFDYVFDTNFAADLTIMEEAAEFVNRFKENKNLPLFTSCCPSWVRFFEYNYPKHMNLLSSCKSPQQMFGAIIKNYLSSKIGVDPEKIVIVSIMPCTAKKYEISREEMNVDGISDNDISISTRELAHMIRQSGIDILNIHEENFDSPLGESSGAGDIFGTTGGVVEAALRTSYEWITDKTLENVNFTEVRGYKGIKEAQIKIGDSEVNICVVNTLGNARKIVDEIIIGESKYHLIEVMACPFGCIGGGGQPYHHGDYKKIKMRGEALYNIDRSKSIRKSHENPNIKKLYDELLEKPGSKFSHKLLHTKYFDRSKIYND